jgi:hypothetical protein
MTRLLGLGFRFQITRFIKSNTLLLLGVVAEVSVEVVVVVLAGIGLLMIFPSRRPQLTRSQSAQAARGEHHEQAPPPPGVTLFFLRLLQRAAAVELTNQQFPRLMEFLVALVALVAAALPIRVVAPILVLVAQAQQDRATMVVLLARAGLTFREEVVEALGRLVQME